jgi:hypothetical protein
LHWFKAQVAEASSLCSSNVKRLESAPTFHRGAGTRAQCNCARKGIPKCNFGTRKNGVKGVDGFYKWKYKRRVPLEIRQPGFGQWLAQFFLHRPIVPTRQPHGPKPLSDSIRVNPTYFSFPWLAVAALKSHAGPT